MVRKYYSINQIHTNTTRHHGNVCVCNKIVSMQLVQPYSYSLPPMHCCAARRKAGQLSTRLTVRTSVINFAQNNALQSDDSIMPVSVRWTSTLILLLQTRKLRTDLLIPKCLKRFLQIERQFSRVSLAASPDDPTSCYVGVKSSKSRGGKSRSQSRNI